MGQNDLIYSKLAIIRDYISIKGQDIVTVQKYQRTCACPTSSAVLLLGVMMDFMMLNI